jgi:hypothetical protein
MLVVLGFVFWTCGCTSLHSVTLPAEVELGKTDEKKPATDRPKTLLEWKVGRKEENGKDKENGKEKEKGEGNEEKNDSQPDASGGKARDKDKEAAKGEATRKENEAESDRIETDRPHLPESSKAVGQGRAVLETGYTYNTSGGFFPMHSFPEALVRVGMFADWFEFRIAQSLASQTSTDVLGVRSTDIGAEDLQLGAKLALTEQQQYLPESAVILQMTVPSGSRGLTANRVLPGIHYDCTWEIIKDRLSVETVILADGAVGEHGHTFTMMGDGVTAASNLTKNLEAFAELDSFYASGDSAAPQHYFVSGLVYFIGHNCEIDCRAGVGLNQHADGYLIGSGLSIRY